MVKICYICGQDFATSELRKAHYGAAHPGYRIGWRKVEGQRGFGNLWITEPSGSERAVTAQDMTRAKRAANARHGAPARGVGRPRKIEEFAGPSAEGPADQPIDPVSAGTPPGPSAKGPFRISQPPVRPTIAATQANVADAVRDALPLDMLASLIRDFSVSLSEADGAGEAGHLSASQSMMIARLLYDQTVQTVVSRFGGNVGRFKSVLAILVIVTAKGSVHARAIGERLAERRAGPKPVAPPKPIEAPDYAASYREPIADEDPEPAAPAVALPHTYDAPAVLAAEPDPFTRPIDSTALAEQQRKARKALGVAQ
jgi:hypothetical protein